METKYINENTAYMYALYELDRKTNVKRQRQYLLASLTLSLSQKEDYQTMFEIFQDQTSEQMMSALSILDKKQQTSFWIYAYAQQSKRFHQQIQESIIDIYSPDKRINEKLLKEVFLQCYRVIEPDYPEVLTLEKMQLQALLWEKDVDRLELHFSKRYDAYFEVAIREAEQSTHDNRYQAYLCIDKNAYLCIDKNGCDYARAMSETSDAVKNNQPTKPLSYFLGEKKCTVAQTMDYWTFVMYQQCHEYQKRLRKENLNIDALENDAQTKQLLSIFRESYSLIPDDFFSISNCSHNFTPTPVLSDLLICR